MNDVIYRQAAIEVIDAVFPVDPMKSEYAQGIACGAALAKTYVEQLPSAQPELTDVQAIEHLQESGWMQNHDKQIYEMGLREQLADDSDSYDALLPSAQPEEQHGRVFKGIVVEYPSYYIYPEYIGKPYFSIKYTENGQEFIGYGTYKPEVLSEYLKEYFMPSAQPTSSCAHENDSISRQAAIREYQEVCKGIKCGECPFLIKVNTEKGSHLITDCKLEAFLHDLPSVQPDLSSYSDKLWRNAYERGREEAVEEIIHCRDCRWRNDQTGSTAWLPCRAIVTPSDFYCARAERREE